MSNAMLTIEGEKEDMRLIQEMSKNNAEAAHLAIQPLIVMGKNAQKVTAWLRNSQVAKNAADALGTSMGNNPEETRDLNTICAETKELQDIIDSVEHVESKACVRSFFRHAFVIARNELNK